MKKLLTVVLLTAALYAANAQESPHGNIKIGCENCHATTSWKMRSDAKFSHASTGFELTGIHKKIECRACHKKLLFAGADKLCASCHTDVHKGELGSDCLRCHSTQVWNIPDMIQRHQQTRFPLLGQHALAPCQSCHAQYANQQFTGNPTTCIGCHRKDYQNSKNPNHPAAGFSTECTQCHQVNAMAWSGGFDHQVTAFPLTGAHLAVQCTKCHTSNAFKSTPQDCFTCHTADYNAVQNPNHAVGRFPHQCTNCHATSAWKPSQFNHDNTAFPLVGAHRTVPCSQCHVNGQYSGLSQNCIDCHRTDYTGVTNPNHVTGQFSTVCLTCHTMNAWSPSTFDHAATKFQLTGKHTTLQCQDCHTNGNYQLTYTGCYTCHQTDFNQVTNPNHVTGNFSHQCETCHSTTSWSSASFDHSTTNFALTGTHVTTSCASCHVNNNYQITFTDCFMCHQSDFQRPTNPNHVAGNLAHTCNQCHTTVVWKPSTFNHTNTTFPLVGAHQSVPCANCHVNNVFAGLHQNCIDCHQTDFNTAANPNHVAGNFSSTCTTCHSMNAWSPATFDHSTTKFALTGKHTTIQCQDCHTNGNYQLTYTGCYPCHQTDFNQVTNPNHVTGNFSHQCETCHSTTSWSSASFDHSTTKFSLTGTHITTPCISCHTNNNYQLAYTNCYMCHQADYQKPTNPNHVAGNFALTCDQCHTTTVWTPSTFNHANTAFPLVGAHQAVPCANCHVNNVYAGLHQNCIDCHQTDFNGTTNPNHVAGNFSTTCTSCHSMNAWTPATFNHSVTNFNQITGGHASLTCVSCHTNNNYQLVYTNCYQCHQSDYQGATSPNHSAGYPLTCDSYQCHTTASWTTSTFNHDTQFFRVYSGKHQGKWSTCVQCHQAPSDLSNFTCTTSCHPKAQTDNNHIGQAGYVYASPNCYSCHRNI